MICVPRGECVPLNTLPSDIHSILGNISVSDNIFPRVNYSPMIKVFIPRQDLQRKEGQFNVQ